FAKYIDEHKGERNGVQISAALAPADLGLFIDGGRWPLDNTERAIEHLFNADDLLGPNGEQLVFNIDDVTLHAPRAAGARVACAGGNFAEHAMAMAERRAERGEDVSLGDDAREYVRSRGIWGFWKVDRESVGHNGEIIYPKRTAWLDYEGEAAIVFGKEGKNIRPEDSDDYIYGVTLLGDWSIRMSPETGPLKFAMQKNFDTSCSIAFSFGEYMESLSRDFTFYPGDILSGGTGAGTAADSSPTGADGNPSPDKFLKPGDIVEIKSELIGTLAARVVASDS
ncbi:MAG: fumarylacetoacetate hydrolase family protein, partial [Alphaproteobacteria bacterium]